MVLVGPLFVFQALLRKKSKSFVPGLNSWVERTYTSTLNTEQNTHLVARAAQGEKYEAAAANASSIQIVRLEWLQECFQQQKWIPVRSNHWLKQQDGNVNDNGNKAQYDAFDENINGAVTESTVVDLSDLMRQQVDETTTNTDGDDDMRQFTLFSACHMILVGFNQESKDFVSFCRLIRKGMGRIAWTLNDCITHIVIPDGDCDESVRDSIQMAQREHPNVPDIISPRWVVACWNKGRLVDTLGYAPLYAPKDDATLKLKQAAKKTKNEATLKMAVTSNLFQNCLFTLLRVAPPSWAVDYNTRDMELLIQTHGGQVLSNRIADALLIDHAAAANRSNSNKRKCFVVCWGGDVQSNLAMHATLGRIQHLVNTISVTPTWLQTCCSENKLVSRSRCRDIFEPMPWPIRKFVLPLSSSSSSLSSSSPAALHNQKNNGDDWKPQSPNIFICLSGFSGSLRSALVHFITALGGAGCGGDDKNDENGNIYDDNLRSRTTHLICFNASGDKYKVAAKRNIHLVSLDWIFHVAQYGFQGKRGGPNGCEDQFPVPKASKDGDV